MSSRLVDHSNDHRFLSIYAAKGGSSERAHAVVTAHARGNAYYLIMILCSIGHVGVVEWCGMADVWLEQQCCRNRILSVW